MKKFLILALLALCVAGIGFSQVFVGGGLSYQHRGEGSDAPYDDGFSTDTFNFRPLLGLRMGPLDVGAFIRYESNTRNPMTTDETSRFGFGAFAYASLLSMEVFSIKAGLEVSYTSETTKNFDNSPDGKWSTIDIRLVPRFEFRPMQVLAFYANIGSIYYTHGSNSANNYAYTYSTNTFGVSLSNNFGLGFLVFF